MKRNLTDKNRIEETPFNQLLSNSSTLKLIAGTHVLVYREDEAIIYAKLMRDKYQLPFYISEERKAFALVALTYNPSLEYRIAKKLGKT